MKGKVKWFDIKKGFGFILLPQEDGTYSENREENNLFVHFSAIKQEGFKLLHEEDEVEFEVVQGDNGEQAADVVVTKSAKPQE